jgi:hypothetical protein
MKYLLLLFALSVNCYSSDDIILVKKHALINLEFVKLQYSFNDFQLYYRNGQINAYEDILEYIDLINVHPSLEQNDFYISAEKKQD